MRTQWSQSQNVFWRERSRFRPAEPIFIPGWKDVTKIGSVKRNHFWARFPGQVSLLSYVFFLVKKSFFWSTYSSLRAWRRWQMSLCHGLENSPALLDWMHFFLFWSMLRSSLQLWQSWSCAKVVMGRQLDRKDWSATQRSKRKQTPKNPQVLTNLWKGETGETGSRSHYLVHKTLSKTPALTTSSASCRKCRVLLQWALYIAVRRNSAIHHSCLPSSSNENAKPCVQHFWTECTCSCSRTKSIVAAAFPCALRSHFGSRPSRFKPSWAGSL